MNMKDTLSPCYKCTFETGRQVVPINCHTYCEKYLNYYKQNEINKNNKRKIRQKENDFYSVRQKGFKPTEN